MLLTLLFYYKAKMTPEILNSTIFIKKKNRKLNYLFICCLFNFLFYVNKNGVELKKSYFQ